MKATETVTVRRFTNGHNEEIFQVYDIKTSKRMFSCRVSDSDDEIRENTMFEIDYSSKELISEIAELLISMK